MVLPIRPANFPVAELGGTALSQAAGAASARGASSVTGASATGATLPISSEADASDFSAKLREALNEVNAEQVRAETASQDYASGKQNDLHGTMITLTQADVSLRLASNVRNRVIEAYREVMRMGS